MLYGLLLKICWKEQFNEFDPAKTLKSFYADDLLKLVVTRKEAINLADELMKTIKEGDLQLTKVISNNKEVMKSIPESEKLQAVKDAYQLKNVNERTLDINWNIRQEKFTFFTIKEA